MLKKIDSYIVKELIYPFFFGVVAFTSISAGVGVIPNLIHESTRYNLALTEVAKLFLSRLPEIIVYTFPTSILLASLVAFNRLSADSEVTAFRAGGVSLYRMVAPALIVGLIVSFLTITFNEVIVPKANNYSRLVISHAQTAKRPRIRQSISIPEYEAGLLKRVIFASSLEGQQMHDVTIVENDDDRFSRVIFAKRATWQKHGGWVFEDGIMHSFADEDNTTIITIEFTRELININYSPEELLITRSKKESREMNYAELEDYIHQQKKAGQETASLNIQLYQKMAIPFACFIFTLLGAPMGIKPTRGSNAVGIGLSLLIVVVYYMLLALGQWMGTYGILQPWLAAWLPNLVVGFVGTLLLVKTAR